MVAANKSDCSRSGGGGGGGSSNGTSRNRIRRHPQQRQWQQRSSNVAAPAAAKQQPPPPQQQQQQQQEMQLEQQTKDPIDLRPHPHQHSMPFAEAAILSEAVIHPTSPSASAAATVSKKCLCHLAPSIALGLPLPHPSIIFLPFYTTSSQLNQLKRNLATSTCVECKVFQDGSGKLPI